MFARATIVGLLAFLVACTGPEREPPPNTLSISVEQTSAWVRNFNPLSPGQPRFPTRAGVHEPMLLFNSMRTEWVPWLAESYAWSNGDRTLTYELRPNVRWSDGEPFDAEDVVFTFELMRDTAGLDHGGVWSFVESVRAVGSHEVRFDFSRTFIPGFGTLSHQPIVPEHVWSEVDDPLTFTNPNPVGTGPFTEIRTFQNQMYEVARNPHYWQEGRPAVEALRFLAYPSNDQANLALVEGSVDWAGNFVPAVERTFVARDPEHFHFWFPPLGSMVFLYANTTRPPFDDVRVRKALSMALDRERIVEIAMYGYTEPADATGLTAGYGFWRRTPDAAEDWTRFDLERANALLDEAGLARGSDGVRRLPDGTPMRYEIDVVSGWSDWVRAGQVIARQLAAVGIEAQLAPKEFGAWYAELQRGEFDLAIAWSNDGETPYVVYRWMMSEETALPVGEPAPGNWHRFADAEVDVLLARYEQTSDRAVHDEVIAALQERFVETAPTIPLFPNPVWAAFSTRRFEGFPSPESPYAKPSPNNEPECLFVLTEVRPRPGMHGEAPAAGGGAR